MAYKQGRGTLMLDVLFPEPVGRIQKASGTDDRDTFDGIKASLKKCQRIGNGPILQQVKDGAVTPLQIYEMDLRNELERTTVIVPQIALKEALEQFIDTWHKFKETTRQGYRWNIAPIFSKRNKKDGTCTPTKWASASVMDLPKMLAALQGEAIKSGKRRTYNYFFTLCQSYLHHTALFGPYSSLYQQVAMVGRVDMVEEIDPDEDCIDDDERKALPFSDLMKIHDALANPRHRQMLFSLAFTGMRKSEWRFKLWSIKADRIAIFGTKNKQSRREIPKVYEPVPCKTARGMDQIWAFRRALALAGDQLGIVVSPHVLRYCYSIYLRDAGIPMTRRLMYLGRTLNKMIQMHYEREQVNANMAGDAEKLSQYIKEQTTIYNQKKEAA